MAGEGGTQLAELYTKLTVSDTEFLRALSRARTEAVKASAEIDAAFSGLSFTGSTGSGAGVNAAVARLRAMSGGGPNISQEALDAAAAYGQAHSRLRQYTQAADEASGRNANLRQTGMALVHLFGGEMPAGVARTSMALSVVGMQASQMSGRILGMNASALAARAGIAALAVGIGMLVARLSVWVRDLALLNKETRDLMKNAEQLRKTEDALAAERAKRAAAGQGSRDRIQGFAYERAMAGSESIFLEDREAAVRAKYRQLQEELGRQELLSAKQRAQEKRAIEEAEERELQETREKYRAEEQAKALEDGDKRHQQAWKAEQDRRSAISETESKRAALLADIKGETFSILKARAEELDNEKAMLAALKVEYDLKQSQMAKVGTTVGMSRALDQWYETSRAAIIEREQRKKTKKDAEQVGVGSAEDIWLKIQKGAFEHSKTEKILSDQLVEQKKHTDFGEKITKALENWGKLGE